MTPEEKNARQRRNYALRMANPEKRLAHKVYCQAWVARQKYTDPEGYAKRLAALRVYQANYRLRQREKRAPRQTQTLEERRKYQAEWFQRNKERIMERRRLSKLMRSRQQMMETATPL